MALLRDLLAVTQPGGLVLDPFTGGGTTGMACMATGRRPLDIKLSPNTTASPLTVSRRPTATRWPRNRTQSPRQGITCRGPTLTRVRA
ncbi:site-specific DNA-methyltransferase [Nitratidesulfovibrio liaohensis]|uniref:Site-specific DNA-methyltransferase n=1 Tax=Nitratidesulfovibrio liaohensis TaxID=2604158 RepID=A0ABY9R7X7_9BACT|nr:DNA methyltransferase [Nitratidesulfovibrio liaohensis]WMW67242.1 site-specific DNA-methyltransferase [Nitratidesulfovibrio liaohensis]